MNEQNAIGPLTILGTPKVGNELIIRDNSIKDPEGIVVSSKEYKWYLNGVQIENYYGRTLEIKEDMQGSFISASLTYKDEQGNTEFVEVSEASQKLVPYEDERLQTIDVLYTYLLKRKPDYAGLKFWADYLKKLEDSKHPLALGKVVTEFMSSDSYKKEISKL